MKRLILTAALFISILYAYPQQRKALLIAISDYPVSSGWNAIHSTNDFDILLPQLQKHNFTVTTLQNEQATKKQILQALTQLTQQARKGDIICLHFSCHGQQVEDLNGDEDDGLDEALIPYDAQLLYKKGIYEGDNHLLDDELEPFILQLRTKVEEAGNLLVTFDACHSGTATRTEEYVEDDDAPVRGTSTVFTSNPFYLSPEKKQTVKSIQLPATKGLSPVCIISACQPFQRNFETKVGNDYYGTLSYAFSEALKANCQWDISLFKQILKNVKSLSAKQIPMVESTYTFAP